MTTINECQALVGQGERIDGMSSIWKQVECFCDLGYDSQNGSSDLKEAISSYIASRYPPSNRRI